jgi:hypothetical protein
LLKKVHLFQNLRIIDVNQFLALFDCYVGEENIHIFMLTDKKKEKAGIVYV